MIQPSMGRPLDKNDSLSSEKLREMLRQAGLRVTRSRLAVLQLLHQAGAPQTHAEMSACLAETGVDRVTVYRNLMDLTEAGLLMRVDLGDHVWRFELRQELSASSEEHPHFLCRDCGVVYCLPGLSLDLPPSRGPRPRVHEVSEVLFKGRCDDCGPSQARRHGPLE